MSKQFILILLVIFVIGCFFYFKRNDSDENLPYFNYQEPAPDFFDGSTVPSGDIVVKITNLKFEPETLNIKRGDKVTWVNSESGYAWPASDPHPTHTIFPIFDPQLPMKTGQAWSFTFNETGVFRYHDHLYPSKSGTINVNQ